MDPTNYPVAARLRRNRRRIILSNRRLSRMIANNASSVSSHLSPIFQSQHNSLNVNGTHTPSVSNNITEMSQASIARKRRRDILSHNRNCDGASNKENIPANNQSQTPSHFQSPLYVTRAPLANINVILHNIAPTTGPSQRHVLAKYSEKQTRFNGPTRNNLLSSFNETLHPLSLTTPASNYVPYVHGHATPTHLSRPSHSSDDEVENSDDDTSMANSSDADSDNVPEPFIDSHLQQYSDIGDPIYECPFCHACMWYQQRKGKSRHTTLPRFEKCCRGGKIVLLFLEEPPPLLQQLLYSATCPESKNYQNNVRTYNAMFSFTSPGMKFDNRFSKGGGPPTLRLHGQTCHRFGSLLPEIGKAPQYAQLYIFDTDNEVENRMDCFRDNKVLSREIVNKLKIMLDECNVHAKAFRMARDLLKTNNFLDLKLKLIFDRPGDGRVYNRPSVSEVAVLIVGDIDSASQRDIIIQARDGNLQRIDEFHPAYLAYQYPLIFVYGEDGYKKNILHKYQHERTVTRQNQQTIKDWLSFRLQDRKNEAKTLLHSRRLFQQLLVDGYAMMESERLNWLRKNQSKLRVGKYKQLNDQCGSSRQTDPPKRGKRVILPSPFVGSKRYMDQLYFDGMEISSKLGFPYLFVTFTCNPAWPEITRILSNTSLKPHDRPDIIAKDFKIKFDELMADITKRHVLGKVLAFMYTIEFQKRGLPHAHILIFLDPRSKYPTPTDIDKIISVEIPDPEEHPRLYNLVKTHMMHGPCGFSKMTSPCMKNGKCSKFFPKKYVQETMLDSDGYPLYRRRLKTHVIHKNDIALDNRYVVPYNTRLLLKYQAHINMEWCNQSTSIKYLFKYIHKGYDRITATIVASNCNQPEPIDEIQQYLDCRYVSPSEACWRIFGYNIHGRKPAVERMFYHLIGEKAIYYTDFDRMEDILERASVTKSKFTAWLVANGTYEEARSLTYSQFVSKFIYDKRKRNWKPRKRGFTIGRLIWVPPTTEELFYLRMMLIVVKGPTTYEQIRKIGDQ